MATRTMVVQDGRGNVIATERHEIAGPVSTPEARIAELEAQLLIVAETLGDVATASSFADAKTKIVGRITSTVEKKG